MSQKLKYPLVEIDLNKLKFNISQVVRNCKESGIEVAGVIKGFNGLPEVAEQHKKAGCKYIASSRLKQMEDCINYSIKGPYMLIRIPMLSELPDLVSMIDCSLQSETKVLDALNKECVKQDKKHGVILMANLEDLREGFWNKEELIHVARYVEKDLEKVHLLGIGTNLGCYVLGNLVYHLHLFIVLKEDIIYHVLREEVANK